ncbi:precorrin-6y C5,15-methyltransferase (decarboxylating) subunit CbiE [Phaeobacter gallaeciensis]|uniref:precorrin-6y C5,15-methyltransferase (decarboxylating) subunit CbiE n=1 Tax=Phaeobacter gallaeciensis TaxID=60890 RepID=UPI00237F1BAD|nr:precorrin-6y C5,15-methyltransferase (decarboxylating) subunit CbiE [Phaeobacter gallaeciensis]MDE4097266.1 precorrin-6y C5,15-methyltransferase (decarboxylating) subunit CbiE [Phaeobacter gallaeciensis]MDE4106220.1 precorrin-6y C5,15-methyltransferase (decarboxylating) subunit CbiE [Phaeobacter gallaeciensis]MDE4110530.1 precorrin-6y C5,15-methyltransferase (decarboxylating) subunit CbiE [Phaeobacter gallaeciensis]MDE4115001.1 precorrin-6y C5,15-methyltransferase (decarboxylating) subunit C
MSDPLVKQWLTIVGLGDDGPAGLANASRKALDEAEVIFGGPRHLELVQAGNRGQPWPVPFSIDPVLAARGQRAVVLASGDPFWHGAGGSLVAHLSPDEWVSHPAPSCFALAANTLGWKLEETLCLGLHAAPFARLTPVLAAGARIICTLRDGNSPAALADWLTTQGFGATTLKVMEALGGPRAQVRSSRADTFDLTGIAAPVVAALQVAGSTGLPRASGLPDDLFQSDGQITKRPIRALTLSALAPRAGELLWDIGGGSGSVSVEWCLAAPGTRAITFEARADRIANICSNADRFGVEHRLAPVPGRAPDVLDGQETPDCVFIGGGGSQALLDHLWQVLPEGTRIVANGVTLETETLLMQAHATRGGNLMKVELAEAGPLGSMRGWERARPVIQWSVTR